VKELFGQILRKPAAEIPDDHPEVEEFVSLGPEERVGWMCSRMSKSQIDLLYAASARGLSLN
jgi:hypothetical protein